MGDLFVWLISFFILISLIVIVIYQLMALADLEFDYINPYDSSSRINKVILPEYITEGVLALVYVTFVCSIPLLQCEADYTLLTSENCCLSVYEREIEISMRSTSECPNELHTKTASDRCDRDIQHAQLGKETTTFQTRLSHCSPVSFAFLDDFDRLGRQ
ncbi:hypothetical protein NC653_008957 [Populus alba x Populus x berolinensis]|uniref:Uncharacterized protein n=1 Tax=Populus alba x Populus x berolinensis TaxID=444605 RepID=A0AAD6W970_9ROSI|nr:hypothetical protein NC653_008957 [Populus alba x Populus x berolinensis]